jgi:hypothetical protein
MRNVTREWEVNEWKKRKKTTQINQNNESSFFSWRRLGRGDEI